MEKDGVPGGGAAERGCLVVSADRKGCIYVFQ